LSRRASARCRQFWEEEVEPGIYRNIDTTFFLWNPAIRFDPRRDY
jgi:hypothetical protein